MTRLGVLTWTLRTALIPIALAACKNREKLTAVAYTAVPLKPVPKDLDRSRAGPELSRIHAALDDADWRLNVEAYSLLRFGTRQMLVARVESTYGTGFYQTAYEVISSSDTAVPRALWSALASEEFTPGGGEPGAPYSLRACLYLANDTLFAYYVTAVDRAGKDALRDALAHKRMPADTVFRQPGLWGWAPHGGTFEFAGPPDRVLQQQCESEVRAGRAN